MWRLRVSNSLKQQVAKCASSFYSTQSCRPAPSLDFIGYNETTTSLILFEDSCYDGVFDSPVDEDSFNDLLKHAHNARCKHPVLRTRRKHCSPARWSCPYGIHDDREYMPPKMDPLLPCQIESIKAIGGISTLELGMRCADLLRSEEDEEDVEAPVAMTPEFVIDLDGVESDRENYIEERDDVWFNRCSTGLVLLSVPSKALEYESLEWILKREEYMGLPLRFHPHMFIKGALNRGLGRSEALLELGRATLQGVRKCVVVDLRGIGIMRKVGLFLSDDEVHRLTGGVRPLPEWGFMLRSPPLRGIHKLPCFRKVFPGKKWLEKLLGVGSVSEVDRERLVCYVKDFGGTAEIMLLYKDSWEGYEYFGEKADMQKKNKKSKKKMGLQWSSSGSE